MTIKSMATSNLPRDNTRLFAKPAIAPAVPKETLPVLGKPKLKATAEPMHPAAADAAASWAKLHGHKFHRNAMRNK